MNYRPASLLWVCRSPLAPSRATSLVTSAVCHPLHPCHIAGFCVDCARALHQSQEGWPCFARCCQPPAWGGRLCDDPDRVLHGHRIAGHKKIVQHCSYQNLVIHCLYLVFSQQLLCVGFGGLEHVFFAGQPHFSYPLSITVSCCKIECNLNTNRIRMVEYTWHVHGIEIQHGWNRKRINRIQIE